MVAFVPDGLREVPGMEDRLEFPLTMMKNDEWNITWINKYLGEMPEAELRKVLGLLSLIACLGGTALQDK